jgi:hypothetical protein
MRGYVECTDETMPENQLEKWTRIQGLCAIGLLVCGALGVFPTWYLAYAAFKPSSSAGAFTMIPAHFNILLYLLLGFDLLFLIGGIGLWVAWRKRKSIEAKALDTIEQTVERVLAAKGIQPDAFNRVTSSEPPNMDAAQPAQSASAFDGEVYRIVTAPKHAFAEITRQIFESMHRDFAVEVDVLIELYLVNTSAEKQYIRDFQVTIEIDGSRRALTWEKGFDAWEVNDASYEYCLDPKPDEASMLVDSRAEALEPIFSSLPVELGPRQPLKGWAHFLLKNVDPKKLEQNQTFAFTVFDSLGKEHPITRAAQLKTSSTVSTRRKVNR